MRKRPGSMRHFAEQFDPIHQMRKYSDLSGAVNHTVEIDKRS
jgi:hypothetical protein